MYCAGGTGKWIALNVFLIEQNISWFSANRIKFLKKPEQQKFCLQFEFAIFIVALWKAVWNWLSNKTGHKADSLPDESKIFELGCV